MKDPFAGAELRPHREMRARLEKIGQEYGPTEQEATDYSIWMRRNNDFTCAYCAQGIPFSMKFMERRQVDHFTPLLVGGRHEIANLIPSCTPCNFKKNNRIIELRPATPKCMSIEAWKAAPAQVPWKNRVKGFRLVNSNKRKRISKALENIKRHKAVVNRAILELYFAVADAGL